MFWRVAGTDVHILGSVHKADRPLTLPGPIAQAIDDAEVLAFESNFKLPLDDRLCSYSGRGTLSANTPPDLFADVQRMWGEHGLPEDGLERTRPWWAMFCLMGAALTRAGFLNEHCVDAGVLAGGMAAGKTVTFLEVPAAGLEPFRAAPLAEQLTGLASVVRGTEEGIEEVRQLVAAWSERRPKAMLPVLERCVRQMPRSYAGALGGRNRAWLPKVLRMIRSGRPTVVTIGGLHMVCSTSLPELLAPHGFRCELG